MPRLRITRTAVDRLPRVDRQTIYWDLKLTGFGVRCNYDSRSWIVAYRIGGKERRKILGRCDRMDIDAAYRLAETIISDAELGISPEDRERERQAAAADKSGTTLRSILTEYLKIKKHLKPRTVKTYAHTLDLYVPDWLDLPIRSITADMVLTRHAEVGATAPGQANLCMRIVGALCAHTIDLYDGAVITINPTRKLHTRGAWYRLLPRKRHLAEHDFQPWFDACLLLPNDTHRDCILTLLFTGSRLKEVASLEWSALDLPAGTVTYFDTKNGIPVTIPTCSYLQTLLTDRRKRYPEETYVFHSAASPSGHTTEVDVALAQIEAMGGKLISAHDLRRTWLTACEEIDIGTLTRKALVNHSAGPSEDVTANYTQVSMKKMRRAVEAVADYILSLVSKKSVPEQKSQRHKRASSRQT